MEVHEILVLALKELQRAELPDEFQQVGYQKALELVSREVGVVEGGLVRAMDSQGDVAREPIGRIAQGLGIERSIVAEVYDASDGELRVVIGSGRLAKSNSGACRQLAILIAGGRQLGGLEEWTGVDKVREACEHFGKYDQANFAATLLGMDQWFGFKGRGRSREIKANRPGTEELARLVRDLTTGER